MSNILIVVFDSEKQAQDGAEKLKSLHEEGSISAYAMHIVTGGPDGKLEDQEASDHGARGMAVGLATGSLIGLLGGPLGLAIGAMVGSVAGVFYGLTESENATDFMNEVAQRLGPGKSAVIAEVEEDSELTVNTLMQAIGGTVFRRERSQIVAAQKQRDMRALNSDSRRREAARDHSEIDDHPDSRVDIVKLESEAKIKSLQDQAEKLQGDAKIKLQERIDKVRGEYARRDYD